MKKLLFLSVLVIFSCSGGDDSSDNNEPSTNLSDFEGYWNMEWKLYDNWGNISETVGKGCLRFLSNGNTFGTFADDCVVNGCNNYDVIVGEIAENGDVNFTYGWHDPTRVFGEFTGQFTSPTLTGEWTYADNGMTQIGVWSATKSSFVGGNPFNFDLDSVEIDPNYPFGSGGCWDMGWDMQSQ